MFLEVQAETQPNPLSLRLSLLPLTPLLYPCKRPLARREIPSVVFELKQLVLAMLEEQAAQEQK